MTERIWDRFTSERDKQVFAKAGFSQRQGFGKRPAFLIVDVNYNFCGDRPRPILESLDEWPLSCGEEAWRAIAQIKKMVAVARGRNLPIIYTTAGYRADAWDAGSFAWKNARNRESNLVKHAVDGNMMIPDIAPQPQDLLLVKLKPSAFHGTPLNSFLTLLGADSLVICGTTTSGCVRASVLDAFSDNYRVTIAEDGCFDRSETSHAINLMDMNAKYADVLSSDEIIEYWETLPDNLFDLPTGQAT